METPIGIPESNIPTVVACGSAYVMEPTMHLRVLKKQLLFKRDPPQSKLQQLWIDKHSTRQEWRDVEVIENVIEY